MADNKIHRVYLGVPGRNFCWGTVTGVVNSTTKHVALPFNGGLGFSGVVDFNWLWTDAQNLFEEGRITHFAMLHGDIEPHPEQRWLDILLDVMDDKDAELVSAVSPIKDTRGVTSSGICNMDDRWSAFRRFTQREIVNDLPDVFNNALAGYPDQPLLHNTACWVCDLRKPAFRETNPDGSLKLLFRFPERIVRNTEGKWQHEQESEDWLLSRELWELGARNTWITSRVKLTHYGGAGWQNWKAFGQYQNGDEDTAHLWRQNEDAGPLSLVQMLEFELGDHCNLGPQHDKCPNMKPERWESLDTSRDLDDDTIVACAVEAYRNLGFTGMIGWIFYNEPLLQADRMFRLMERIKDQASQARFILWTNGMLIPEECEAFRQFDQIVISAYNEAGRRGCERLAAQGIKATCMDNPGLDDRLVQLEPTDADQPCLRPHVEFIIDHYGNHHLCCYDWQGRAGLGNVFTTPFADLAKAWRAQLPEIAGASMTQDAPGFCRSCGHRWTDHQLHDKRIIARARQWRASQQAQEAPA